MAAMPAVDAEPVMDGDASFAPPASPSQRRPGDRAVTVLWSFGKCLGALLPVYLAGYYGFSISVVLFGLVIFMGWKHSRLDKVMRLKSAMYLLENERTFTTESVFRAKRDLPPWAVKVVGVKAHTEQDRRQVMLDLYLSYAGDVEINVEIKKYFCKAGVKGVQWFNLKDVPSGSVHLRLEWLSLLSSAERLSEVIQKNQNLTSKTEDPPSAAILAIYLDQAQDLPMRKGNKDPSPMVQISIQDTTRESKTCYGTNSPIWSDAFTFFIQDPSKQDIDIQVKDDDRALSLGTLTIPLMRLLGSPELTMDQWFQLENSGSASRIYVKIVLRVLWLSDEATPTTPSPRPSASGNQGGQSIFPSNQNTMGSSGLGKPLLTRPQHTSPDPEFATEWYTLNDVKSGRVHLVLEWLPRVSELNRLEQILQYQAQQSYQNKVVPSSAMLFVYVERAHGLPLKKSGKEPKVGADVLLKNVSHRTKVCERSTSPRWDEGFHFLVRDPKEETLTVKLSHSWGQALGSLTLPLRDVLLEPGMVLDRWINLDGALPESQILLRVMLKILDTQLVACRRDADGEISGDDVIPRWVPSHLDIRQRTAFSMGSDNMNSTGQVKLTIGYSTEEARLFITVHACRALAACSKDGADPYVSFILLPDKKATTKRRTATKKRDLNPEFNERFDFDFSLEESYQRRLDLSVKNSVSFMSRERELIGKLQLDLEEIDLKACVTQWYDLVAEAQLGDPRLLVAIIKCRDL
ncbi:hypothetical protein fugu_007315 [Takifugu bimaculatus]|uniref:C2 domain-containing protein n=1 Tax=Takifugu bimaculatus TaxID=433685 RepID=A0A4Z2B517_9TELE|nr:hypothetical protein fugu_007315 [Takifugu bimaculatus]